MLFQRTVRDERSAFSKIENYRKEAIRKRRRNGGDVKLLITATVVYVVTMMRNSKS